MWTDRLINRAAGKVVSHGLHKFAAQVRARGGLGLAIALPDGQVLDFGQPPTIRLTVRDPAVLPALARPTLGGLGAAYVEGRIDLDGPIDAVIAMGERLATTAGASPAARVAAALGRHVSTQDKADVCYHYDVSNDFYALWLDPRMVYSCAYFRQPDDPLEVAQEAKLEHICRKLRLAPGERLLDIGCGWGGLVLYAAARHGVQAVGITLSEQQHALATERVVRAGLTDRVQILRLDYRELPERFGDGAFDKVASIGMFEHVGLARLPEYFGTAGRMLRERGLFLNHGITASDVESRPVGSEGGEFIDRYVFPNGELPHLHLAVREMSAAGFEIADVESLRPHYARTLAAWSRGLEDRRDRAAALVSEKVLRIWRLYLAGCSYAFDRGWVNVYQMLGSRQTQDGPTALPLTRDWMYR